MKTLYQEIKELGIETDNHESDLLCEFTPEAYALMAKHGVKLHGKFRCNRTGKLWLDIPFMFDPFWERKAETDALNFISKSLTY